jgi:hypothetical protein
MPTFSRLFIQNSGIYLQPIIPTSTQLLFVLHFIKTFGNEYLWNELHVKDLLKIAYSVE